MKRIVDSAAIVLWIWVLSLTGAALAQTTLHVYGPGGPAPAMKEAAAAFEKQTPILSSAVRKP